MSDELNVVCEDWRSGHVMPCARIRQRVYTHLGVITEFCVQLEYNWSIVDPSITGVEFEQAARFDHNGDPVRGHNLREEGLHMDFYADGQKQKSYDFPDVPLPEAPRWCVDFFKEKYEPLLARYERKAGINPRVAVYR